MPFRVGLPAIAMLATWFSVHGDEPPALQFSAFGTLALTGTDTHQVGFRRNSSQYSGAIDKPSGDVDSRYGVQVSAKLSDNFLATLQVVSRYRYDGTYKPEPAWACLSWNPVSNLVLRAGFLSFDVLPNGDLSNVGNLDLWVRPPVEVYGSLNLSRFRGVDIAQTFALGPANLLLKVYGGETVERVPVTFVGPWDLSGGRVLGAVARLHGNAWGGRAAYTYFRLPANLPGSVVDLQNGLRDFSDRLGNPRLTRIAASLDVKGAVFQSLQLTGTWERGPWQAQGVLFHSYADSFLFPNAWNAFLSCGYRLGKVVPYLVLARAVSGRPQVPDVGNLGDLPPQYGPLVEYGAQLAAGLDTMVRSRDIDQRTFTGGLRWDFAEKADLKFQVDVIRAKHSTGLWQNLNLNARDAWNGKATVMTLALDFVFGGGR